VDGKRPFGWSENADNPGHASGTGQCSCLSHRFSGRLVLT